MSDESDESETDAHIRALLAELGSGASGETMPPEVSARLDDTLARLVAERGHESGADENGTDDQRQTADGTVVPLRRRWLPRAAVAAAAVIVVGLGGVSAVNLGLLGGGSSSDSASSSDAGGSTAAGPENEPENEPNGQPETGSALEPTPAQPRDSKPGADTADRRALAAEALPKVSSAAFSSDVSALLRQPAYATNGSPAPVDGREDAACPGPVVTDGSLTVRVRYDGRLAVLVAHPEQAGNRLVEAWSCAGDRQLTETTLTP